MRVEAATSEDSRAIAEVHVASWQAAYTGIVSASYLAALSVEQRDVSWRKQLLEGSPQILVAREGSRLVGFVAFGACREPQAPSSHGEIWALYVLPSHWSAGVGRTLWLAALAALLERGFTVITLWVLALNERAIKFYKSAGFAVDLGSEKLFTLGSQELAEIRLMYKDGV
jgi:ribosomal protein S18 acetylase RimI-like enzyme